MTSNRLDLYQDSRKKSIIESITDIIIGFLMYLPINFFVLPMFADQIANQEIVGFLQITAIFTMVAFVRKYTIRRWFSKMRFWMKILNLIERIPQGIVLFILSIVGIILAVVRKRIRLKKLIKVYDSDGTVNINEMLDDLNCLVRDKDNLWK